MSYLLIFLAISLVVTSVGWKYFIYFFSIGYGFTIAALSITTLIYFYESLTLPMIILCGFLIFYGFRLALYLLIRERKSSSYRKILYQPDITTKKPVFVMVMIWLMCALLYLCQISPLTFFLYNAELGKETSDLLSWIAVVITALGVMMETIADAQKNAAKKVNVHRFVDTGLYKIVRCPNYFGEMLMWTGCFLLCFGASCTFWQWVIAILGYVGIIYVMFSGARRLEIRQNEVYANNPEYHEYIKKTPLIIPFVPIYSVVKYTWLKA